MRPGARIAFDVGTARVGVARCDADAILAVPLRTLHRDRYGADLDEAADLVEEHGAVEAVVGLPRHMAGGSSSSTRDARRWARQLASLIAPVPVRLVDERLTTVTAQQALHASGRRAKDFRAVVDQAAAVVILEHALETERRTGSPAGELVMALREGRA
ncbi:Holliday junction resolvase RuvX [Actinomyces sp. W5033]|uniref:Holliday junction resolvase RuvX n=1 Tax=Actinomyces sp. W5033 TaxID=3446479 RepID=UPI003EDFDB4A